MSYSVVFSTRTGNTKLLAETVRKSLSQNDCIYFGYPGQEALHADRLYVGFWTDRGCCDNGTAEFLRTVKNKELFLFGSAGYGGSEEYYQKILRQTESLLDDSCRVVGTFMCQGKMPESVRKCYEEMTQGPNPIHNLMGMLENFDKASSHPDRADLEKLEQDIQAVS